MSPLGLVLALSPLPGPRGHLSLQPQLQLEFPPRGVREARKEVDRTSRTCQRARVLLLQHDPVSSVSRKAPSSPPTACPSGMGLETELQILPCCQGLWAALQGCREPFPMNPQPPASCFSGRPRTGSEGSSSSLRRQRARRWVCPASGCSEPAWAWQV